MNVKLPNASSLQRTDEVCRQIEEILRNTPGVDAYNTIGGLAFLNNTFTTNVASFAVRLKPWAERNTPSSTCEGWSRTSRGNSGTFPRRSSSRSPRRPSPGSARRAASRSCSRTAAARSSWSSSAPTRRRSSRRPRSGRRSRTSSPRSTRAFPRSSSSSTARRPARSASRSTTSSARSRPALGGAYVNDFNRFGRLYRVYVQAEAEFRRRPRTSGGSTSGARPRTRWCRSRRSSRSNRCPAPSSPPASTSSARSRSAAPAGPGTARSRRWTPSSRSPTRCSRRR